MVFSCYSSLTQRLKVCRKWRSCRFGKGKYENEKELFWSGKNEKENERKHKVGIKSYFSPVLYVCVCVVVVVVTSFFFLSLFIERLSKGSQRKRDRWGSSLLSGLLAKKCVCVCATAWVCMQRERLGTVRETYVSLLLLFLFFFLFLFNKEKTVIFFYDRFFARLANLRTSTLLDVLIK